MIKKRAFLDDEIKIQSRLQLRNASIYSTKSYSLSTLKITEAMQTKLQQLASRCIRSIKEAGKQFGENQNTLEEEHETSEK